MAKGVAEIALLLVLRETGLIGADVFSLLVLIMLGYILLMPPVIGRAVQSAETSRVPGDGRRATAFPAPLRPRQRHRRGRHRPGAVPSRPVGFGA